MQNLLGEQDITLSDTQDWNEVDRSIAVILKMNAEPGLCSGSRYQEARKRVKEAIIRPIDTHLVHSTVDKLTRQGQVVWNEKAGALTLNLDRVREWVGQLNVGSAPKRVQRSIRALDEAISA